MALAPRCENCTKYKPHNNVRGECTDTNHKDKGALRKFRKRNDKCINANEFNSK